MHCIWVTQDIQGKVNEAERVVFQLIALTGGMECRSWPAHAHDHWLNEGVCNLTPDEALVVLNWLMVLGGNCGKQDVIPVCMHACVTCSVVAAALCWLHYSLNLLCKQCTPVSVGNQQLGFSWSFTWVKGHNTYCCCGELPVFLAANGVMQDKHTAVLLSQYAKRTICATEEPWTFGHPVCPNRRCSMRLFGPFWTMPVGDSREILLSQEEPMPREVYKWPHL